MTLFCVLGEAWTGELLYKCRCFTLKRCVLVSNATTKHKRTPHIHSKHFALWKLSVPPNFSPLTLCPSARSSPLSFLINGFSFSKLIYKSYLYVSLWSFVLQVFFPRLPFDYLVFVFILSLNYSSKEVLSEVTPENQVKLAGWEGKRAW